MTGRLVLVAGPSGSGKDTLLDGARNELANDSRFVFTRRTITRRHDAGGEDHESVDENEFSRRRNAGEFLLHWRAHGYAYAIPISVKDVLASGRHVIANVSRTVVRGAVDSCPDARSVLVTAPPDLLHRRLTARNRETEEDIRQRVARATMLETLVQFDQVVVNDRSVDEGIAHFVNSLHVLTGTTPQNSRNRTSLAE